MSEQSTPPPHQSTSSAVAFLARTSATPASVPESTASEVGSGPNSHESFAFFDHESSSLKTSQRSLFGGWTEFSETLPRSGTMRSGRLYVHPMWARLIDESESSSSRGDDWPTPMSYGHGEESNAPGQTKLDIRVLGRYQDDPRYWPTATAGDAKSSGSRNLEGSKAHPGVSLTDMVTTGGSTEPRRWPTPEAADGSRGSETHVRGNPTLLGAVRAGAWPTPKASASHSGQPRENDRGDLQAAALLSGRETWPTPSATPYGSSQNGINGKGGEFERPSAGTPSLETIAKAEGGKLSPDWVESLMGFPLGWTAGLPVPAKRSTRGSRLAPSPDNPPTATLDSALSGMPSSPLAPRSSDDES
jgi:hypothetical protein